VRAFVAVRLPVEVRDHLDRRLDGCRQAVPGVRWTAPERWHLTLTFLAELPDDRVPDLAARLARAASRTPPLRLHLGGGGRFGRQVLWVGVGGQRAELRRAASRTSAAARHAGLDVEDRPYRPHVTVARAYRPVDLSPATLVLAGYQGPSWDVEEVELVKSTLGATPRYETVATFPLAGAG
jgi:2'-5' RNA ligase